MCCSIGVIAQIIFLPCLIALWVSIGMLQWLDKARTPTKYLIIFLQQTQNLTITSFQKITQSIGKVAQTVAKTEE